MSDKIAIITGGNRGLGRATALKVAAEGVDVILTYRSHEDEAAEVVSAIAALGRNAVAHQLDTTDVAAFPAFVAAVQESLTTIWGRDTFDYLVNNAGAAALTPFGGTEEAAFDSMVNVHLKGVYFLTQSLTPSIADGGRIVLTSTGLTRFFVDGNFIVYAAVKGAVEVLGKYLGKILGSRGISVNVIAPGPTATDFGGGAVRDNEQVRGFLSSQTAMGRVGEAEDIAGLTAALLSPALGWVTAQRIEVSGGAF